jgi:hypothetical protein
MSLPNLQTISELLEETFPKQKKAKHYIDPVVREMSKEWIDIKKQIADIVVGSIRRKDRLNEIEELEFSTYGKNEMFKEIQALMRQYKKQVSSLLAKSLRTARSDSVPKLTSIGTGRGGFTTIKLSKEGLEEVIDNFKWQKNFVDDLSKSVIKRVENVTKGRYASSYDLRKQINRQFRIDRDGVISKFHEDVRGIADKVIDGKIDSENFQIQMRKSIEKRYRELYQEGKGTKRLSKWEEEFIQRQVNSQNQYLDNFRLYIDQQRTIGKELTGKVRWRAELYAERGTSMFEAGHIASLPNDVLLDWEMQPAEHCNTCPIYQAGSPYTKETLPGFPGEGFHLTQCGTNCKCILQVSDLYVTTTPEIERDLDIEFRLKKEAKKIKIDPGIPEEIR